MSSTGLIAGALPRSTGHPLFAPWAAAAAVIVFRSLVYLLWEQSCFDSDQAIVGLMAKHIAEWRALPLLFYGQPYTLAVESWLAAPVLAVFGASVWALKAPLVALNIVVAGLLLTILVRDAGLSRVQAFLASLFFLIAPPIAASRLVEATGASIEPFLYTLLLWLTRRRPVLFGAIAGVGYMNREFTAYAVLAIVMLELWHGTFFTKANLRGKAIAAAEVAACALIVRALMGHADLLGPGSAGTLPPEALNGQVRVWLSKLCWNPSALAGNLRWLFERNLGALMGWRVEALSDYFVRSSLTAGHSAALAGLGLLGASGLWATVAGRSAAAPPADEDVPPGVPARAFPAYLVIVGLLTVSVYALATCSVQDTSLVRYTLLALFIPIGVAAAVMRSRGSRIAKGIAMAAVVVWACVAGMDNARLLAEYTRHPPANEYREFADFLEREGIWYGHAPYWTAYQIDFLTQERVTLGSFEKVRISEYEDVVETHTHESVGIYFDDPCTDAGAVRFSRWCLLYVPRARHPNAIRPPR